MRHDVARQFAARRNAASTILNNPETSIESGASNSNLQGVLLNFLSGDKPVGLWDAGSTSFLATRTALRYLNRRHTTFRIIAGKKVAKRAKSITSSQRGGLEENLLRPLGNKCAKGAKRAEG